jgi:hypothetical protein
MCRRTKWYISRFGEIIRVLALLDKEIVAYSRHVQSILTAWIQLTLLSGRFISNCLSFIPAIVLFIYYIWGPFLSVFLFIEKSIKRGSVLAHL